MFLTEHQKEGQTAQQKRRYLCTDCRRQFITRYTYRGCQGAWRALIVPLALNGAGIRDTVRVLGISLNTVLQTLRAATAQVPEPLPPRRVQDLEIVEFGSFIQSKKRHQWVLVRWDRQRKKITTFVLGRRTDASCGRLIQKHAACRVRTFHTDDWQLYRKYLPPQKRQIRKSGTQRIKRRNLDFRPRIKRLQRRTICFSKCPKMHEAVLKLHIHYANSEQHHF